jgi:tRNA(adenine34) deaminase
MPPTPSPELLETLMMAALREAERASNIDEVPVGCTIAHNGVIIGRGHNTTEASANVVAHAELNAIREASSHLGNWRLTDCIMCVTLEPCTMCLGAIRLARIPLVVFGAGDSKQGAVGSLYDLSQDERLGPALRVISGIKESDCQQLLKRFFLQKRTS